MSMVITWATPDEYPEISHNVANFIIQKQTGGQGPFVTIATIDATTDGLPKGPDNEWMDQYEDPLGTPQDFYQVAAKSTSGKIGMFSKPGPGGYMSTFHAVLQTVRFELGDDDPFFYQLDTTPQFKWNGTKLGKFLVSALNEFNGFGPMVTNFSFDNLPIDALPVIEQAVMYKSLMSRSIREIPNYMKYDDGVSFDLSNRPGDYDKAGVFYKKEFKEDARNWKLSHRPEAIGLGSQRLPFRVTRPLSMLPNMKNVFGF